MLCLVGFLAQDENLTYELITRHRFDGRRRQESLSASHTLVQQHSAERVVVARQHLNRARVG